MSQKITEKQFNEWKEDYITKQVFSCLDKFSQSLKEVISNNLFATPVSEDIESNILKNQIHYYQAFKEIINNLDYHFINSIQNKDDK